MDESDNLSAIVDKTSETGFKKRPRKKHLYNQISQQMEFYFSDANLCRDRFLSQLLEQSKNVPLEVFLRFNKIRALTGEIEEIAKALGNSQLLKVTDDGKCVYRTCAVQKKENQDDCIIYVEQLPPDANHEWVIGIFSAYGKVEYVSIPKYKNRAAIKGFAFVEFDTPEAAKKALQAFGSVGCCLPPQMPPEELCSIATFEKNDAENARGTVEHEEEESKEDEKKKLKKFKQVSAKDAEESNNSIEKIGYINSEGETEEPKLKRLRADFVEDYIEEEKLKRKKKKFKTDNEDPAEVTVEDGITESEESNTTKKSKKRKLENEDMETHDVANICNVEKDTDSGTKRKKRQLKDENNGNVMAGQTDIEVETEASGISASIVKTKKKKRKQQIETGSEDGVNENEEIEEKHYEQDSQLSKKKRKKRKNEECEGDDADSKHEEADDEGTAKIKKQADEEEDCAGGDNEKSDKKKRQRSRNKNKKKNIEKKENDPTSLGLRIISKNEWRRLRNKYLNLQREKMQALKKNLMRAKYGSNFQSPYLVGENRHQEVKQEQKPQFQKTEYLPGVIIRIKLTEPIEDVNTFKTNARLHQGVKYIDANEGDNKVHVRCTTAEFAQKLVEEQAWSKMKVLKGEAESAYWEKIWQDRQTKISKKIRGNVRGRDKLLKHAERELGKHIKFDD